MTTEDCFKWVGPVFSRKYGVGGGGMHGIEVLLVEDRSLEVEDDLGRTPVAVAVLWKDVKAVKVLFRNGANPNGQRVLISAVNIAEALLDASADPDALDDTGRTPLSHAAESGHVEVVQLLLQRVVDISLRVSERSWTALHWAVFRDRSEIIDILQHLYEGRAYL
ncbi:ankyrin repeat-containing domain protein [Aspergillus oleicola]